jgi:hypothetical protein
LKKRLFYIGLIIIFLNLLGVYFLGLQIAFDGIGSTQSFTYGFQWDLLPILAFITGIVAGIGWMACKWWTQILTISFAVMLALSSPVWAQQVDIGILIDSTRPPQLQSVLEMCIESVVFLIITIIIMNISSIKSAFPAPPSHISKILKRNINH